jgi:hypothetical protein
MAMSRSLRLPASVLAVTLLGTLGASSSGAAVGQRSASVFVSLKNCPQIDGPEPGEGGDFATQRCGRPVSGWQVLLEYDDSRESITLLRGKKAYPLNFWTTVNGGFSSLGPKFEFRTRGGRPVAGVVRYRHRVEDTEDSTEDLVVVKLAPTPCVASIVKAGPNQSAEARALADRVGTLSCV